MMMMQRSMILSELRATITGASVDYVGSVTIHEEFCTALGLLDRQMVHIRNQRTGVDLWTYVICGVHDDHLCPLGTICLNGAAAHLVQKGDVCTITARGWVNDKNSDVPNHTDKDSCDVVTPRRWDAVQQGVTKVIERMGGAPSLTWAHNVILEFARGKIHRPRITGIDHHTTTASTTTATTTETTTICKQTNQDNHAATIISRTSFSPALYVDENWAEMGGIQHEETIHLVNVTNGQRDVLTLKYAPRGSLECSIHNVGQTVSPSSPSSADTNHARGSSPCAYGSRPGYKVGDVVIAMNYGYISRGDIVNGRAPQMKICFPFERPRYCTDKENRNPQMTSSSSIINETAELHSLWTTSLQESSQESICETN